MQPSRRQLIAHALAFALVLGTGALVFSQTRSLGLLGMDTYPIILTSKVASLADFWGNFSERLMDGLYPGEFYRPLLNFTFAADYAVWGLEPSGYQLSNALWFAASGLAFYLLLVARPAHRSPHSALVGLMVFLWHPLHFEAIPYPPRRPELMCLAFMLLALAAEARVGKKFRVVGALATLLALASKETALILPALVFAQQLIFSGESGRQRGLSALRAAVASTAVVAVYLVARVAVLGGIGGHRQTMTSGALAELPQTLGLLVRTLGSPQQPGRWDAALWWGGLVVVLAVAALVKQRGASELPEEHPSSVLPDLLFGASWIGLLGAMVAASGRMSPWYLVTVVAGFAFVVAGLTDEAVRQIRRRGWIPRVGGVAALLAVLSLSWYWQMRWSPLVRSYQVWQLATDEYAELIDRVKTELEAAGDGSVLRIRIPHYKVVQDRDAAMFRGAVLLGHYSVQAWAGLVMPERKVRVLKHWQHLRAQPAKRNEVVVVLDRAPKPSKRRRATRKGAGAGKSGADSIERGGEG
ncbi:MAG: hypothetical protein AAF560_08705 [Acidobacteriota bacterium]